MSHEFFYLSHMMEEKILEDWSLGWEYFHTESLKGYQLTQPELAIMVEYITCYSQTHFYLMIRINQEKLVSRDRSYQHGDGFHFVLAAPKEGDQPTDEFYVIGISPLAENWRKKFIWYHNIDLAGIPLKETRVDQIKKDKFSYFLVQISWKEIAPLQPFIIDKYGFNLSYVQAVPSGVNIYMLKNDDFIQWEQSKREYLIHTFEEPKPSQKTEWSLDLTSLHYHPGQNLQLLIGANGFKDNENSEIKVKIGEKIILNQNLELKAGLNRWEISLDIDDFSVGTYSLEAEIKCNDEITNKNFQLIIYDWEELAKLKETIEDLKNGKVQDKMIEESISTLEFEYQQIKEAITRLKPYESFSKVMMMIEKLTTDIAKVKSKENLFNLGKTLRLGIRSHQDNTLQPYSLYIPKSLNGEEKISLKIFLHGSGSDDRSAIKQAEIKLAEENNMIIAAPFGRGTSHCYCPKEAMEDIIEVTHKVMELFPVDKNKVFLSGFSMGGYGTLRVFDYYPKLFHGLIVISGHYYLGKFLEGLESPFFNNLEIPDYSSPEKIEKLKEIPMIFFHGKKDQNLSYQENALFFDKLQKVNPQAEIYVAEDVGHSGLTEEWLQILQDWLEKQLND